MAVTETDISGVLYGSEIARKCCSLVNFNWKDFDGSFEEFQELMLEPTAKRLADLGIFHDVETMHNILEEAYIMTRWLRFKKVYDFHPTFVDYLAATENGKISSVLLERLPFKSFYISFGRREMKETRFTTGEVRGGWAKGMFVTVFVDGEYVSFGICVNYISDLKDESNEKEWLMNHYILKVQDGNTFENATDYTRLDPEDLKTLLDEHPEEDMKAARSFFLPFFRIALNACNYLCASNAEIKDVKIPKKDRPKVGNGGKKRNVAIQTSKVGYRLGQQFEKMYRDLEAETRRSGVKGIKKKPHVRRAHWHHYWTGPGRTVLEVRWLEPVFVMGTEEEIDAVVHEVKGESA